MIGTITIETETFILCLPLFSFSRPEILQKCNDLKAAIKWEGEAFIIYMNIPSIMNLRASNKSFNAN